MRPLESDIQSAGTLTIPASIIAQGHNTNYSEDPYTILMRFDKRQKHTFGHSGSSLRCDMSFVQDFFDTTGDTRLKGRESL